MMETDFPLNECCLEALPDEIQQEILGFLSLEQLATFSLTSKTWYARAQEPSLWKSLCAEAWDVPSDAIVTSLPDDWKQIRRELVAAGPKRINTQLPYDPQVRISEDRFSATFTGRLGGDRVVFADACFPRHGRCPKLEAFWYSDKVVKYRVQWRTVAYYEITILPTPVVQVQAAPEDLENEFPELRRPRCVSVGLARSDYPLTRSQVGWRAGSFGYHSDDGAKFGGRGFSTGGYGPQFGPGDTVGCGFDFADDTVFFTKNGKPLPVAFVRVPAAWSLYPVVGLDTNDTITFNFGDRPFLYDFVEPARRIPGTRTAFFSPWDDVPDALESAALLNEVDEVDEEESEEESGEEEGEEEDDDDYSSSDNESTYGGHPLLGALTSFTAAMGPVIGGAAAALAGVVGHSDADAGDDEDFFSSDSEASSC
eukprot:TRINITY_DN26749_c0_g1_i1.p1 TRINITY_DN26749_c0_g1~~TRINITY_DN26749_c0_g1_i1.p1  ORF type:complete len:425 (-),score=77.42 TRINITY_DN26749_c0_g1_i1:65-1339(-)